jgi:nickel transport protein
MKAIILGALLSAALSVSPAWAHKVSLFAYAEGGTVYTESYFPDGKMVEGGLVEVRDEAGKTLLEGTTDHQGHFSFPLARRQDLAITVNAGMGHKNSFVLRKEEM